MGDLRDLSSLSLSEMISVALNETDKRERRLYALAALEGLAEAAEARGRPIEGLDVADLRKLAVRIEGQPPWHRFRSPGAPE